MLCGNIAEDKFVTFFYGLLDCRRNLLTYSNAGHLPPIVIHGSRGCARLTAGGLVLGVLPTARYDDGKIELLADDRVLLFTDGLTEAMAPNDEEYGDKRIESLGKEQFTQNATGLIACVMKDVSRFCDSRFNDDATMIAIAVLADHDLYNAKRPRA